MAKKMRAVQVSKAKGPLEVVEREIPEPKSGWVRVKVEACGVCHSDSLTKDGLWPGIQFPRIPGHEVIGVIDAVGSDVPDWKSGQRVGIGWHASHCGHCDPCRRGDFFACQEEWSAGDRCVFGRRLCRIHGRASRRLRWPSADRTVRRRRRPADVRGLDDVQRAAQQQRAAGGDLVAVLGLGGLGHLGVQYAAKMGFKTVAIARGQGVEPLANQLGATHYIDSKTQRSRQRSCRSWEERRWFWQQ